MTEGMRGPRVSFFLPLDLLLDLSWSILYPTPSWRTHEVDADAGDEALGVGVISESEQQARLADARVADEQHLEQVVAAAGGPGHRLEGARERESVRATEAGNEGEVGLACHTVQ
eukprot:848934-Rhodomonas_salina.2